MNTDSCYHVPTAPGQSMCGHLDYQMWLRFVIEVQAEVIADLSLQVRREAGVSDALNVRYVRQPDGHTVGTLDPVCREH